MFYYMNEAVWAYQNMFITYYNENWDYSQKMLAKSLKEITKKCFRKLKDTKMYDFDRFSPLPFKKEKKTGLFRKSVFLHLGLSVNCNGLVWKRRWSILAELCYYKEKRKMSLSVFHQTTSCLSQYCTCYHLISPPSVKKKKALSMSYMYTIPKSDLIWRSIHAGFQTMFTQLTYDTQSV